MAREITDRATTNSPVAIAKWDATTIPFASQYSNPNNALHRSSSNDTTNWSSTDNWCTNISNNTLWPPTHKGAGEDDAGATDGGPTVANGRHQEEAGRNRGGSLKCLGDADEVGSDGDSGGGPAIPILSADGSLGYPDGGGLIQHTDSHITEPHGSHHTSDTPGRVIDHTGSAEKMGS